ncbi:MAG: Gfo/Idh/MocA family oxidoreductase [Verrucomicrobiae bacterium]|nr:Gfo/Idh/MocA family oxidoreductase [Verrucomicrobiae bacterium]
MKWGWGILGAGKVLAKVAAALPMVPGAQLVAIASRDPERARDAAACYGALRWYGEYQQLLANPDIDIVLNALHNGLHAEWTIRALQAGKHVLCEKPLAPTAAEVDAMFDAARAARRWLMEGFMYRFHPQIIEAYRRVQAGEIGDVLLVRANYATRGREPGNPRYRRDAGGGALLDVGCYTVNFARLFFGAEPRHAVAAARWSEPGGVDLTLAAQLDFGAGRAAHLHCSFEADGCYFAEVIGTQGSLRIPNPWLPPTGVGEVLITRGGQTERLTFPTPHLLTPFVEEMRHFQECIEIQRPPQFPPGIDAEQDSRANARALELIARAA